MTGAHSNGDNTITYPYLRRDSLLETPSVGRLCSCDGESEKQKESFSIIKFSVSFLELQTDGMVQKPAGRIDSETRSVADKKTSEDIKKNGDF